MSWDGFDDAADWQDAGLDVDAAAEWRSCAFDARECSAWSEAGITDPAEARALADLGLVPELATVDIDGETATAYWRRTGDPNVAELALKWRRVRRR